MRDSALIGDLNRALAAWRKRASEALDLAERQTARVAELEALVETLRCGDLGAFHDGELETARADAFRAHLAGCERCGRELLELMQVVAIASTPTPREPAGGR
jgi:hypothetical protein